MKNSFKIMLLVFFLHNISYSQDKSKVECGFFGNKTIEQRNAIFPFSETEKVLLISYPNAEAYGLKIRDSINLTQYGYKIEKEFIFHDSLYSKVFDATKVVQLKNEDKNDLSNIMLNYNYKLINIKKPVVIYSASCYTPRNAILFLDKKNNVVSLLEICFECDKYYLFPKSNEFKDVLGVECDERLSFFRNMFDDYGFEDSEKNKHNITFEIKGESGPIQLGSLIISNSHVVKTDFDGNAFAIMSNKIREVEFLSKGKSTFIKIVKNSNSIKVDISKGKAFYYKDKKFIKSKKLIFE